MHDLAARIRKRWRRVLYPNELDLRGDREIEWSFVSGHIPDDGKTALDFGCGNAPVGLAAALKGYQVVALDQNPVKWVTESPQLVFRQGDILALDLGESQFDLILNCSSVEHVGLAGRFGSVADTDGDLKAMERLCRALKPQGTMLLTIPIGQDRVCQPYHRIYGPARLPLLLAGYRRSQAQYWVKRPGRNVWVQADEPEALAVAGGPAYYALGLFVLTAA